MEDINFKGNNPGAVRYGNFINYYQFHPPEKRLSVLPTHTIDVWEETNSFVGLDIGCNSGDLTLCLHDYLTKNLNNKCSNILGIDLDPVLIDRASEKNGAESIKFECLDFTNEDEKEKVLRNYLKTFNKEKFDAIFCFSVTMWIHLNKGDDGLIKFLEETCRISNTIVIEPQPWKCYKAAVKRLKSCDEEFPEFKNLKIRSNVENEITSIILKQGFCKIMETEKTEWGRKLLMFKSKLKE